MTVQVNLKKQCNGFFEKVQSNESGSSLFILFFILSSNFPHCVLSNFVFGDIR